MKHYTAVLAVLVFLLSFPVAGQAHRVNVFAYVDGDAIRVEGSFSKSQKVRRGKVLVTDLQTGAVVTEGVTDGQGVFSFRPPADILQKGHGLNIRLLAGEGHQDDWQILPGELRALPQSGSGPENETMDVPQSAPETGAAGQPAVRSSVAEGPAAPQAVLGREEFESLIGGVMDAKLAPIKQALARQEESGPGLRDIVGGIGWILGLLGLATYMRYR